MADPFKVRLVATDREIWSGESSMVSLETLDGATGLMPGHSPLLGILRDGPVLIRTAEHGDLHAAVHGGFVLVDAGEVIILAETAELAEEINLKRAEDLLQRALDSTPSDSAKAAQKRAETRIKVAAIKS
ncbi:MAG: F0F1 ATP synthase subunit epsilon [Actinomycetes bacterium]